MLASLAALLKLGSVLPGLRGHAAQAVSKASAAYHLIS
jgi:hypothetical protein